MDETAAKGQTFARFVDQLYARVAPTDRATRSPDETAAAARSLWELAAKRPPRTVNLRVIEAPAPTRTIVEIVNDDMPFLLDSLTTAIVGEGLTLRLAIHPIMAVRRQADGSLADVYPAGGAPDGARRESIMRLEIEQATDASERARLGETLRIVLAEVRAAVEDWRDMRDGVAATQARLTARPPRATPELVPEARNFLSWLLDDFFVFLGSRQYIFNTGNGDNGDIVPGSSRGILRDESRSVFEGLRHFVDLPAYTRAFLMAPRIVEMSRSSERSRVLRAAPMDAVAVKLFDESGAPSGIQLFVGLFTWHAYRVNPQTVPLLAGKVENVLRRSGAPLGSHDRRALIHIIESLPRDELFQLDEDQLLKMALGIRDLEQRPRVGLFVRPDPFGRFYSCFVFVPRDRYRTELRQRFVSILTSALDARLETFHVALDDQALARVTFFLRTEPKPHAEIDVAEIEARLADAARNWSDGLREAMIAVMGDDAAATLFARYRHAFPAGYRGRFSAREALGDIALAEKVDRGAAFALAFAPADDGSPHRVTFKLFGRDTPMALSDILPLLEHLGLRVTEENPFGIALPDGLVMYQNFSAESLAGPVDVARDRVRLETAFAAILDGTAEDDGFNRLLIAAGLDGREVSILRLFARFLRQTGTSFSLAYMEETLARHGAIAARLVSLFRARFDPAQRDGAAASDRIAAEIEADLEQVANLDDDRILRAFLTLMRHSLRTNFFLNKPYLSVKFASGDLDLLPLPRPLYEIFVSSPWMEGVHLRAGMVARGGIRWSDRREDFRTEILGLMKAQVVKNAVIVPTGSKGGFVVKKPPAERAALQEEAVRCYRTLLDGMLDITDNYAGDKIVPPKDVVRYDGDDPYLVVAADKGTATFSDIANGIAVERGFWLGDAFASGGSEGYDHKEMGITARGAWELVKRHFRERGTDIQATDFTVAGVGDMSGDVFGNGMLQSRHIRLVAAFDHRHIFLDPDPDPAVSYDERARLYKLPRSSWADYNRAKMSPGGGVFPRGQKSIPLSPQIRARLGVAATALDPASLIRAILKAPVDLLWFGGIGTYVKASGERNADAGDRANDANRIDGRDIAAPVVGEGANLGVTQLGRIEYALKGGRIDTDSIDNSAGVDTSDREVNIKIALDGLIHAGRLDPAARHKVLHGLTDEVAALVLADNDAQGQALTLAETAKRERFEADVRLIRDLERSKKLDRAVDFLPDDETIAARAEAGAFLTRPELCVLLSLAKNALVDALMGTDYPEGPDVEDELFAAFPPSLVRDYRAGIEMHRLRREIVATVAANALVNRGGIAFANEQMAESGRDAGDVGRAFAIACGAFGLDPIWDDVRALDNKIAAATQTEMLHAWRRLLRVATGWLLRRRVRLDVSADIAAYRPGVAALSERLPEIAGIESFNAARDALCAKGVPEPLAVAVARLDFLDPALAIVELGGDPVAGARQFVAVGEKLKLGRMAMKLRALAGSGLWQQRAAENLIEELYRGQAAITRRAGGDIDKFLAGSRRAADHFLAIADEIDAAPAPDLARLLLASQALAALAAS
ncbi:MAG TPA: NAD-glutamate dehydrogenase [Stellaceae bacterium]|nr:NAD-glutamate dehydrogenase [Stellaceae bacterium]